MHEASNVGLELCGVQSIRTVETVSSWLRAALRDNSSVILDCGAVAEIDLSFIQLLISAHRTAVAVGKTLSVVTGGSCALHEALLRAGLTVGHDGGAEASDLPPIIEVHRS